MQAMMSDCEARVDELAYRYETCLGDGALAAGVVAGMARDEARRILAVAESGDGRRVPAFRVEWGAAPTWERAEASLDAGAPYFKALADSLASFLAAPDPAAYLAGVAR